MPILTPGFTGWPNAVAVDRTGSTIYVAVLGVGLFSLPVAGGAPQLITTQVTGASTAGLAVDSHPIAPLAPRAGQPTRATVVGPVCESGETFVTDVDLPPLEVGDFVVIGDAGAYGAVMSSNYNGRGRLTELTAESGQLRRPRRGETVEDLRARDRDDVVPCLG